MKKYLRLQKFKSLLILAIVVMSASTTFAFDDDNYVIITGQVSNKEFGYPIVDQFVFIESEQMSFSSNYYFNTLVTDEDGFFYDTISTQIEYGSFEIYTFDHNGIKESETLHFRFQDITNSNTFLINFHIYMPSQPPALQAKFRIIKKATGDKFRFKFVDETKNNEIISWYWNFGDGHTSTLPDPEHIYTTYGMFKVSLTITAIVNGNEKISIVSKYAHIPLVNYYHLGGHCYSEQFPIDFGKAILYSVDENGLLLPFDTTSLNETLGHYYFYQVPEGRYCVKTQPDETSEFYGNWIPTYYGDSEFWKEAEIIELDQNDFTYHVNLVKAIGIPSGLGEISGKITFTSSGKDEIFYPSNGVDIYLLDANNQPLSCQYTVEDNYFHFENMAMGSYWIYPELTGFTLEKQKIKLTNAIPVIEDVEILINTDAVYLIFPDQADLEDNFTSAPYPNPASNQISFEFNAKNSKDLRLEIVDLNGRVLMTETINLQSGLNKNTIQTDKLTNGFYFLRLTANDFAREQKVMISR